MKRSLLAITAALAAAFSGATHAARYDTYQGLAHTETESGFVSGAELAAPGTFDFLLGSDSLMTFSGESSFSALELGLFSGTTLLRGWLLTPSTGNDVTTFSMVAGSYSFKTLSSVSGPGYFSFSTAIATVPEPDESHLLLAGLAMIGIVARHKLNR
ncbi:MAG: hypothetical protein KDE68_12445 [Rhodocyclaceae bacterium]|nr:hypothetical protein [Rhodocyclaceae bacterium]